MTIKSFILLLLAVAIILAASYIVLSESDSGADDKNANKREVNIKEYYLVSLLKEGSGMVTGAGSYLGGRTVEITAVPDKEYNFKGWYKNNELCSSNASYKFDIDSNCDLTAKFERITYHISVVESGASGAGTLSGGGTYHYGEIATMTAIPTIGYEFSGWYDGSGNRVSSNPVFKTAVTCSNTIYGKFSAVHGTPPIISLTSPAAP